MKDILIVTGDLREDYEIIDTIFAIDYCKEGVLRDADPGKAFEKVKSKLKKKCKELGGDAVINCRFEYNIREEESEEDYREIAEIFAYGTVVYYT